MEIKGKIKEISVDERQAKVTLQPQPDFPMGDDPVLAEAYRRGLIMSSNQPIQMATVRQLSEGDDIIADVFVKPGKPGTRWAGMTFYNINSIGLDLPVIQVKDELQEPEKPVGAQTVVDEGTTVPETKEEADEALRYTPESAQREMGRAFVKLMEAYKEYDKTFKK